MRRKSSKQLFSVLMAATMVMSGISIPVNASQVDDAVVRSVLTKTEAEASESREINFNEGWKFHYGDVENAEKKDFDDSDLAKWGNLKLPHDFSITQEPSNSNEAESGFMPGGTGWYRKNFTLPSDYEGKSIVLNFDGSYNHTYVYVNGTKVGENHYGYNDFAFDISKHLICDGKTENVISVKVVHQTPSSRWYSGSGIYRDVELIVTDAVHVSRNGVYVTTPELATEKGGNVTVKVQTKVQNDGDAQVAAKIRTTVLDAEGKAVSEASTTDVTLTENGTEEKEQNLKVNNPALWSTEKPNLYYVQTEVLVGDEVKDINKETFGFRYIDFNSNTGFSLNGKNVKLKGVCMHHDQGALGSASEHDAVYRQVSKLKEMGCNAIRTAHNTPSSVLLKACNELGMMVMDETFDGWAFPKNGNSQDFSTHYNKTISEDNKLLGATAGDTWYKFVLESNIERDKNDPSVVIWDIGNELNFGVTDPSKYEQYAKNMKSYIEAIDKTRPITVGDNNPYGLRYNTYGDFRNKVTAVLANKGEGLAGANYSMAAMSGIHSAHPDWKIIATETASPSNSRGIYTTLSQYGKSGDYQCTAYDTNAVSWGNTARESWWYTIKDDFVSGEFIWTGFDYIGEPTPWNGTGKGSVSGDKLAVPNSSYFGVIDTAGFEKDSFYFYTSQWREDKQTLHIVPQSWNKKDLSISGGNVPVYVYSNAAKVELYLNGKLIGTSTRNPIKTAAGHEWATYSNESNDEEQCVAVNESPEWKAQAIQFKVKYAEGTLSAKAYDEDGKEITDTLGSQSVTTNSDAGSKLSVKAEKSEITADGSSLSYIAVDVNDKDGRFVSSADNSIRFTLTGNGTIVGLTELEILTSAKGYTSNKTAELEGLKVDGTAVEGFAADKYEYTVVVDKVDQAVVDATAKDNASVMVVPFNKENVVKIIVTSEDSKTTNTYKIKLIAKDQIADKAFMEKVEGEIKQAEALKKDDYTDSSYAEYEKALKEVKAVIAKEIVTKDEVNAALEKLQTARGNLVKVTKPAPDTNKNPEKPSANKPETGVPSVGMLIKYKKAIYKVREVNATGGTVMLVKRNSKKAKFVIPATIKSGNYTFKVTSIANKAFKGDKKLKKVVIGKNVQVIGKRAFEKAKNLRNITIKSVALKKVGRSAFKGIHAKAKIKVPAKKMKAYKRLLKKKGQKSSVKIIK